MSPPFILTLTCSCIISFYTGHLPPILAHYLSWPYVYNILIFSSTPALLGLLKPWRLRHQTPSEHWCYLLINLVS